VLDPASGTKQDRKAGVNPKVDADQNYSWPAHSRDFSRLAWRGEGLLNDGDEDLLIEGLRDVVDSS
jgi:hypothetical protein